MNFYCKKCGLKYPDVIALTRHACSTGGKCAPYEGRDWGNQWPCKKCGYKYPDIRALCLHSCRNGGKCEPMM